MSLINTLKIEMTSQAQINYVYLRVDYYLFLFIATGKARQSVKISVFLSNQTERKKRYAKIKTNYFNGKTFFRLLSM